MQMGETHSIVEGIGGDVNRRREDESYDGYSSAEQKELRGRVGEGEITPAISLFASALAHSPSRPLMPSSGDCIRRGASLFSRISSLALKRP